MNFARIAIFLIAAMATAAGGPWDLDRLRQAPRASLVEQTGTLRPLYYSNEPFHGKPTRVFAYYAVPEKLSGKAPAMVLVHG